jgi:hypothetical protein
MQSTPQAAAITAYRDAGNDRASFVSRLQVRREDAPLLRSVASALADPARAAEIRPLLRARFASPNAKSLKDLLADAPRNDAQLTELGAEVLNPFKPGASRS